MLEDPVRMAAYYESIIGNHRFVIHQHWQWANDTVPASRAEMVPMGWCPG